jgi:hypothetical protein
MRAERGLAPWDVSLIGTQSGLWVHLVENRVLHTEPDPRALCGNKAVVRTATPFSLNGCKRCCQAALKAASRQLSTSMVSSSTSRLCWMHHDNAGPVQPPVGRRHG